MFLPKRNIVLLVVFTFLCSVASIHAQPLSVNITPADAICYGYCDGSATANSSGGTPPYAYQWNDSLNQTTQTATGLCAGTYSVVVTDSLGQTDTASVAITEPSPLVVSITSSGNIDCFGNCNGFAHADATGGTPPYTYIWNTTPVTIDDTLSGLCDASSYCVTVTDANGCSDSACVTITEPQPLSIDSIITTDVPCAGDTATAYVSGGTYPYTYVWYPDIGGQCTSCDTAVPTFNVDLSAQADTFWISPSVVRNGFCCGAGGISKCIRFNVTVHPMTEQIMLDGYFGGPGGAMYYQIGCGAPHPMGVPVCIYGATNFCITFCKPGNNMNEYYITAASNCTSTQTDSITTGLTAGTHVVSVTDANGCTAIDSVTITEPPPLAAFIDSVANIDCFGNCNGFAQADATGGTPPYTYLWDDTLSQVTDTAIGLCAGTYCVTVTDANGCSDSACVIIAEPNPLIIIPTVTDVSCFGGSDGMITLLPTPIGGTPPYSYSWIPNMGNFATITNLTGGLYTITVTDINGCVATQSITVNEPTQLTITGSSFPSICGNCNGAATVIPFGGTPPYYFLWNTTPIQTMDTATGLCAGTYNVLITDAYGCTITISFTVTDVPGPVIDSISSTNVTCNGICEGTATASVSGGTSPLNYSWNTTPVQTTLTATGLCAGTHIITVTDLNSCIAIDSIIINEPDILEVITSGDTTICSGDTAQISFVISGGVAPYVVIDWCDIWFPPPCIVSPDTTTTYTAWVTDANGCTDSGSVTVTIYPPLSSSVTADTICAGASTTLTASASGGNGGPYTYAWLNDGSTDSTITVSPTTDSTFTVVVSDGGCSINDTISAIVVVEICSGVDEQDALKGISVYPNPNTGEFVIEMLVLQAQDVQIKIINVLGQEVYTEIAAMTTGIYRKQIDLASYPRGIYTLQIITDDGLFNKKVIVE